MHNKLSWGRSAQRVRDHHSGYAQFLRGAVAGLTTATLLAWVAPVEARVSGSSTFTHISASEAASEEPSNLQLTCVPQGEKFLCEAMDEAAIAELQSTLEETTPVTATINQVSLPDVHRIGFTNFLLTVLLVIAGIWGAKRLGSRQNNLEEVDNLQRQIDMLERIWDKSSSV